MERATSERIQESQIRAQLTSNNDFTCQRFASASYLIPDRTSLSHTYICYSETSPLSVSSPIHEVQPS